MGLNFEPDFNVVHTYTIGRTKLSNSGFLLAILPCIFICGPMTEGFTLPEYNLLMRDNRSVFRITTMAHVGYLELGEGCCGPYRIVVLPLWFIEVSIAWMSRSYAGSP